jgi:manganese efflux pump family protein
MPATSFLSILIIAIGLSADCFAVSLSAGIAVKHFTFPNVLRLPLAFGIFQALMTLLGWLAGSAVIDYISAYDHWLAFGLLVFIGGRMIWESFHEKDDKKARNYHSWLTLLALSIATSIDSLAVGLSFAFLEVNIVMAAVTIGVTAFVVTAVGQLIGRRVGTLLGKWAEILGGLILIAIGIKILLEHLL